jgi:hypothetical protein
MEYRKLVAYTFMNTHTDGLFGNTYKRKTLMNLESAKPAVDQPSEWVDVR